MSVCHCRNHKNTGKVDYMAKPLFVCHNFIKRVEDEVSLARTKFSPNFPEKVDYIITLEDLEIPRENISIKSMNNQIDKSQTRIKEKSACPGLGLFYTVLSAFLFSVASLFLKKIENVHSVEISGIRCIFQMLFVLPGLIYYKTGFLGPRNKRIYLFFRGLLGSSAMILLYYAFQAMPLADATVITFSSPVFTSLFAWIFLKEKYSLWDLLFTLFTITGVILIARPPFLFGSKVWGIEGTYTDHLKGTIAAIASAIATASTFVILRKVGKSVHYFLSIWYYAVIGLILCVISLFVIDAWTLPNCGIDRWLLILIGLLGLGGQIFLTKALQIENAGPVAIMKTMDVVFAFILQILFLDHLPTWWTVGGALCVVASSSGTVIRKWHQKSKKSTVNEI